MKNNIPYPYLPNGKQYLLVESENIYMHYAREFAKEHSLDFTMPTGTLIVKKNKILGKGANGSDYHKKFPYERVRLQIPTGQKYELCEGCHPKNHSERSAINNANLLHNNIEKADLYLWGHWWCCASCWDEIIAAKIRNVYLLTNSQILFNKNSPDNIIGIQFNEK